MHVVQNIQSKLRYRMIVKVHRTPDGRKLVAICDSGLIGKKFEEGKLQLDLSSNFYKGEEKSKEEILNLIDGAYIINIVGEKSVEFVLKLGVVKEENIIKIDNVPHVQAILE